jgi:hypothetical protein
MITEKNFFGETDPDVGGETEFTNCNFAHPQPVLDGADYIGVRVFPGDDTPRTFTRCNLVNCEVPPGSTMTKCNRAIVRRNVVTNSEDIVIGAETITVEIKANLCYGHQIGPGIYNYYAVPSEDGIDPEE